jgi:hypothetical protein
VTDMRKTMMAMLRQLAEEEEGEEEEEEEEEGERLTCGGSPAPL